MTARHFPRGRKYDNDEDELDIKVATDPEANVVRIDFDKPIRWVAFEPDVAIEIAALIIQKAVELQEPDDVPRTALADHIADTTKKNPQ
jgi:hypothetical protein